MNSFRKLAMLEILKQAGSVSEIVDTALGSTSNNSEEVRSLNTNNSFKDQFLKLKPGPEREALVYNQIAKTKPKFAMVPVTVNGPQGIKITYKVMPDYLTIDGIRVPMSGQTAQKVANLYGYNLPTAKMSQQIWEAADTKIRPTPLSSGGTIGGKYYSGQEVVAHKIGDSDSAEAYSAMIEAELKKHPGANLVAGHMKDLVQPMENPDKLGLYGWQGTDGKPIQYSAYTPHDTKYHTEYGSGVRLVDDKITVTTPDGKTINTTMEKLLNSPKLSKTISDIQGVKKYNL